MKVQPVNREQFIAAITDDKADKFAKTFRSKADMQDQWDLCLGCWDGEELMGAIIISKSKRKPTVFNLQLLHTFAKHRRKGVGRVLVEEGVKRSYLDLEQGEKGYLRVSSEQDAVVFYERVGFKFLGKQKSGCSLSMMVLTSTHPKDGYYSTEDPVIYKAVHKKGKGGCVEVFDGN